MRRASVTLLIALETVLLIAVIVYGVFTNTIGGRHASADPVEPPKPTESSQAGEPNDSTEPTDTPPDPAVYREERLTFSDEVEAKMAAMTLEEKVAQLFFITPEALTGVEKVTVSGNKTTEAYNQWPVGGLIYDAKNFQNNGQTVSMLEKIQTISQNRVGLPLFLAVAEEGGAEHSPLAFANQYTITPAPGELAAGSAAEPVMESANIRAGYLKTAGFNMIFGPVCDLAQGANGYFDERTYGSDPQVAGALVAAEVSVMEGKEVLTAVRYFPWKDSREESRSLRDLLISDLAVYQNAINAGADFVIVSNGTAEIVSGSEDTPCCLCEGTVSVLRLNMGYDGVLMTDSLSESSITDHYSAGEAAVAALAAGIDVIYDPADFEEAYNAVLQAAGEGNLSMVHLENAVGRVLTEKSTLQ